MCKSIYLKKKSINRGGVQYAFRCPGCKFLHAFIIGGGRSWKIQSWKPLSVSPSVLTTWEHGAKKELRVCHLFIKKDRILFLSDCTHALVGQNVPMVPIIEID